MSPKQVLSLGRSKPLPNTYFERPKTRYEAKQHRLTGRFTWISRFVSLLPGALVSIGVGKEWLQVCSASGSACREWVTWLSEEKRLSVAHDKSERNLVITDRIVIIT
jgi:hypothetical protein